MADSTYGVEVCDGARSEWYLGDDETLWDWANAPVKETFREGVAEVPLPEGYAFHEDETGEVTLVEDDSSRAETTPITTITAVVSEKSTLDDMAYILIHSMRQVSYEEFETAKLPSERIMHSTAF